MRLKATLIALPRVFALKASSNKEFREHLSSRDCVVQFRVADNSVMRHLIFKGGKVTTAEGMHDAPDMVMQFKDVDTAVTLMTPPVNYGELIHAAKNFKVIVMGPDDVAGWFTQLANRLDTDGTKYGEPMKDGSHRYTQMTNGGPLHVYVKDGKILRTNMIEFAEDDPQPWTIEARGKKFSPRRRSNVAPHAITASSAVYSLMGSVIHKIAVNPAMNVSVGMRRWISLAMRSCARKGFMVLARSYWPIHLTTNGEMLVTISPR